MPSVWLRAGLYSPAHSEGDQARGRDARMDGTRPVDTGLHVARIERAHREDAERVSAQAGEGVDRPRVRRWRRRRGEIDDVDVAVDREAEAIVATRIETSVGAPVSVPAFARVMLRSGVEHRAPLG